MNCKNKIPIFTFTFAHKKPEILKPQILSPFQKDMFLFCVFIANIIFSHQTTAQTARRDFFHVANVQIFHGVSLCFAQTVKSLLQSGLEVLSENYTRKCDKEKRNSSKCVLSRATSACDGGPYGGESKRRKLVHPPKEC